MRVRDKRRFSLHKTHEAFLILQEESGAVYQYRPFDFVRTVAPSESGRVSFAGLSSDHDIAKDIPIIRVSDFHFPSLLPATIHVSGSDYPGIGQILCPAHVCLRDGNSIGSFRVNSRKERSYIVLLI